MKQFHKIVKTTNLSQKEKLIGCCNLCNFDIEKNLQDTKESEYATKLLLGIPERRFNSFTKKRLKNENLLVHGTLWTAPLDTLLSLREVSQDLKNVYSKPKKAMEDIVNGNDLLSNTPLEVAYRWSLACTSSMNKQIEFVETQRSPMMIIDSLLGEQTDDAQSEDVGCAARSKNDPVG